MFYRIGAYNTQALYAWASDENNVVRYVDWLNRDRDINHYQYATIALEDRSDVLSMDEPYWDDFILEAK